jgi:D-alanyl-D-alanine carboxypeptidase
MTLARTGDLRTFSEPALATPAESVSDSSSLEPSGGAADSVPASLAADPVPAGAAAGSASAPAPLQPAVSAVLPTPLRNPLEPAPWGGAPALRPGAPAPPRTGALSALVLDEASAAVLYEADAHRRLPPASLTKIAAAVVALRAGDLDTEAVSDVDGFLMRGSTTMGLLAGDRISRRDLLYGLMLPSGNDAALVLGRSVAGSDDAFVARMNALVEELGLRDTSFATPHGLGRLGYSSAYDLAILSRHAMQLPEFANVVQTTNWGVTGSRRYSVYNVNGFIFNYAGADGVKTGFTNGAGKTLVASATRDGHRLYAVLLNDAATTSDAAALLDWAFRNHTWNANVEVSPEAQRETVSTARTSSPGTP